MDFADLGLTHDQRLRLECVRLASDAAGTPAQIYDFVTRPRPPAPADSAPTPA